MLFFNLDVYFLNQSSNFPTRFHLNIIYKNKVIYTFYTLSGVFFKLKVWFTKLWFTKLWFTKLWFTKLMTDNVLNISHILSMTKLEQF